MMCPAAARADTFTQYDLQNVGFADGSSASGTFVYDATTGQVTQWSIAYTGGSAGVSSTTFTPGNSGAQYEASYGLLDFGNSANPADQLNLFLGSALGTSPDSVGTAVLPPYTGDASNIQSNAFPACILTCQANLSNGSAAVVPIPDTITQFSLQNVGFADGSSASGTFVYDATTGQVTQWSIAYTGGSAGVSSTTFTPGNSGAQYEASYGLLDFGNSANPADQLNLFLGSALGTSPDAVGTAVLPPYTGDASNIQSNAFPACILTCQANLSNGSAAVVPIPDTITQFYLENIDFADGSIATGNFTFNETLQTVTQWSLAYTGGSAGVPSTTFTPGNSGAQYESSYGLLDFGNSANPADQLNLFLGSALGTSPDAVGTAVLPPYTGDASNIQSNAFPACILTCQANLSNGSAAVDPAQVPEPASLPLLLGALGLFLVARRVVDGSGGSRGGS